MQNKEIDFIGHLHVSIPLSQVVLLYTPQKDEKYLDLLRKMSNEIHLRSHKVE